MSEMSQQPQFPDSASELTGTGRCPESTRLRHVIERLSLELAHRKADPRPLPSSVMRAYQALIDKYYAQLADLERSDSA